MSEFTDAIQKVTELATGEFAYVFAWVGECSGIHHSVLLTNCTYEKMDEIITEYLNEYTPEGLTVNQSVYVVLTLAWEYDDSSEDGDGRSGEYVVDDEDIVKFESVEKVEIVF